jgi:hypothetical protein
MTNDSDSSVAYDEPNSWDLSQCSVCLDIGFLAHEAHRAAFRQIFGRVLTENRDLLDSLKLTGVDAKRPISDGFRLAGLPMRVRELRESANAVADALYDSHNPEVVLHLAGSSSAAQLHVTFDNPAFKFQWLASHAAA